MTAKNIISALFLFLLSLLVSPVYADAKSTAPWGHAKTLDIKYPPHKVIYDLTTGNLEELDFTLSRISYLNNLYDADPFESSIIVVIHEKALEHFAIENLSDNKQLMERARNLTIGSTIEFRMCKVSAKFKGYEPEDIHGFVQMVPMADAEIIRLQLEEGYAYLK